MQQLGLGPAGRPGRPPRLNDLTDDDFLQDSPDQELVQVNRRGQADVHINVSGRRSRLETARRLPVATGHAGRDADGRAAAARFYYLQPQCFGGKVQGQSWGTDIQSLAIGA
jgi:hypothetical protein